MRSLAFVFAAVLLLSGCAHGRRSRELYNAQLSFARELTARRAWPGVIASVERLHRLGPRSAETLTLRGVAYREQRLFAEAEADLRAALELRDDYAPAHSAWAVLLDLRGRGQEAEAHHRRAVALAPDDAAVLNDFGFSLLLRGKRDEAVPMLRRAADRAPLDRRVRNNLGFALALSGEFSAADAQFALGGTPAEAKNNLGFAYETAGNLAQAFEAYLEAVRLDPTLQRARGNLEHAARALNRAVPEAVTATSGRNP